MSGEKNCLLASGNSEGTMAPPWGEECYEDLWEKVEGVRHKLTRILNPAKLTPYLRQCKVIDEQDEDEVLNSTQLPLRISKAGRLLDILRGRGERGLQAFMESLEFYHPEQYTQLTGRQATQRCSMMLDEEGPEGLTQFLMEEVRKLREQVHNNGLSEHLLAQRCRAAEVERSRAERRTQELRQNRVQLEKLRQDWEASSKELSRLKEIHVEQAVKYTRAMEDQRKASAREKELLTQVEQLRNRLMEAEKKTHKDSAHSLSFRRSSTVSLSSEFDRFGLNTALQPTEALRDQLTGTQALLDILQQDRREAAEQRQELCSTVLRLQGELESTEAAREMLEAQYEQLQLKVRTLQLDCEMEHKRSESYYNQIMELEREREQALRSRDNLQLEFTDCLLDKNRLRKRIAELQSSLDQVQRELEREREKNERNRDQNAPCRHGSNFSLLSEDCYFPCCSFSLDHHESTHNLLCKSPSAGQNSEKSEEPFMNSEENLYSPLCDSMKEINRLSIYPFPPCMNSINRRVNTEFDLDSWGSDEADTITDDSESSLSESCVSLQSRLFLSDLVNQLTPSKTPVDTESLHVPLPVSPPKNVSLANDITIVGGNRTGIFVQTVRSGSPAEKCGLREGSELLEMQQDLFVGGTVELSQCTGEVAHFSLQWWTEPASLKHRVNEEGYSRLSGELSSPLFTGADSFYVRVNLDLCDYGDPPCLRVSCNDILHVTDTRYNGKYQWRCTRVDTQSGKTLQAGAVPNYNRAQQLMLVRLRTMTVDHKDNKKKFCKKGTENMRLVKAAFSNSRKTGTFSAVLYTLSNRVGQEENLIPYSMVQPVEVDCKRPVVFSPSLLSHRLIERLLQPAESGLHFNTCQPEPISGCEHQDKSVFLLDSPKSDQTLGIRLQSIHEIINQDKHCLLELGLNSVESLLKHELYPIIIHIKPKDKKGKKFRKLLSCGAEDEVMVEMKSDELLLETLPLVYCSVEPNSWSCTDELLTVIRNTIHSQQGSVAWVETDRLQ